MVVSSFTRQCRIFCENFKSTGIGQAYRNPDLGFQNLLIHREIEAKKGSQGLPIHRHHVHDFPEIFLEGGFDFESQEPVLLQAASLLSSK
jgi:hypothetical protein